MSTKLEILYRPKEEFRTRNDIAIHILEPNYRTLLEAIEDATSQLFPRIVVYVETCAVWHGRFNCLNGNSTWSRLMRDINGEVRCGEVGFKHGRSEGDGFTIYFEEN